jgi:hypothetical protein
MSATLTAVQALVEAGDVIVSAHGEKELANDGIDITELTAAIRAALVVEEYPTYAKGPCVLVLQRDAAGRPVHVLWGIRKGTSRPAVVITAYRPDPVKWSADFLTRRP